MPAPAAAKPVLLPQKGTARVKNLMSGDTVVLWGKAAAPGLPPPQVQFTLEGLMAPRMASKNYPVDDPGAFPAREFLRSMLVGKMVSFETTRRKPQSGGSDLTAGAGSGDSAASQSYYHYGHIFFENENVALKVLKNGHANVRDDFLFPVDSDKGGGSPGGDCKAFNGGIENGGLSVEEFSWRKQFAEAYQEGLATEVGIHSTTRAPLVRSPKNVEDAQSLVQRTKQVTAVIEYIFDGSRYRCQVTNSTVPEYLHSSFTLILAGVLCPRSQRPAQPTATHPLQIAPNATPEQELQMGAKARLFVEERLLQRELTIVFHGTDKSGGAAVATVHHPKGNIAVDILTSGLGRIADWSVRLMDPKLVHPLRIAENTAKKGHVGVWTNYQAPQLSCSAELTGTCLEVVSGDTIVILPFGTLYESEDVLQKVSLASIRSPRPGSDRAARPDEPFAWECKERLRVLCAGKQVKVQIHYERDIPLAPDVTEKRRFGTISVGKRADVSEVLLQEGLASTQRHRDDDEKSPRYDELRAAESAAKASNKGIHKAIDAYKKGVINDLTEPKKAKPSPSAGGTRQGKKAEPFGDASKRHARLTLLQRTVEITCSGVTNGGVITGKLWAGQGGQSRDYSLDLLLAGLATVDQRRIDYGDAPKELVEAQAKARASKVGVWSLERSVSRTVKHAEKSQCQTVKIRLSEILGGNHFFFHLMDDDNAKVVDDSMKAFTETNGTDGAPCDVRVNKIVAALFDDGNGKSWYRAKIVERKGPGRVAVLFLDHGNVSTVPVATHLRPLDLSLDTDCIPPVAKEAMLALTLTPSLDSDEGVDAARMLQQLAWGKDITCTMYGHDDNGKLAVGLSDPSGGDTINEDLISAGLARVAKQEAVNSLAGHVVDGHPILEFSITLNVAQERARKARSGMWRYGDVGDEDDYV